MSNFEDYYIQARDFISKGLDPSFIAPPAFPEELIDEIKNKLVIENAIPTTTSILSDKKDTYWYKPEFFEDNHWSRYKDHLIKKKEWPKVTVDSIDDSTTQILKHLSNPKQKSFSKTGLVIGYIQSGKTANYTGLIAKAADVGYNLFIVYSGVHNNLREQTQNRLMKELIGDNSPGSVEQPPLGHRWISITSPDKEFYSDIPINQLQHDSPIIIITKKICPVLERLNEWFSKADTELLSSKSVMFIDDEADYATINTGGDSSDLVDLDEYIIDDYSDEDPSRTNELIRTIRNRFDRFCHIGYTATPFANVLIDPFLDDPQLGETLYPRDFVISLPKPAGYFGTENIFPYPSDDEDDPQEENDYVQIIPDSAGEMILAETDQENYPEFGLPSSLLDALYHFILTGVVKDIRGVENKHHTFLIHSNHMVYIHGTIYSKVTNLWQSLRSELMFPSRENELNELKNRLNRAFDSNREILTRGDVKRDTIMEMVPDFVRKTKILQINSEADEDLDYDYNPDGLKVIAIGGNRLSRGLTLEGLTTSYFTRSSRMYDTLLQMGRWFGYRPGYDDLVRIYTTSHIYDWFCWLNHVEESIRLDIARYDDLGKRPDELAVRIKTHPAMLVTSPLKMGKIIHYWTGFDGQRLETSYYYFDEVENLEFNQNRLIQLLYSIKDENFENLNDGYLWKNIRCSIVLRFLQDYKYPIESKGTFDKMRIIKYIEKLNTEFNELDHWSILLASSGSGKKIKLFDNFEIGMPTRGKDKGLNKISMLSDPRHFSIDLPGHPDGYLNKNTRKPEFFKSLEARDPSRPILILYLIDKDSKPTVRKTSANKEPLFPEGIDGYNCLGLSMVFPYSENASRENYVHVEGLPGVPN